MIKMQDIKYLREFFGLDEELLAKFLGVSTEKYLQMENNQINFDVSNIHDIIVIFLQNISELHNRVTPLVPKFLPYSLRNLTYTKFIKTYEIATNITLYERLITKYKQFAEEFQGRSGTFTQQKKNLFFIQLLNLIIKMVK